MIRATKKYKKLDRCLQTDLQYYIAYDIVITVVFNIWFHFKFRILIVFQTYRRGYFIPIYCVHLSNISVQTVHQIFSLSWFIGYIVTAGPQGENSNLVQRFYYIYFVSWIYKSTLTTTWQLLTSQFPIYCLFPSLHSIFPFSFSILIPQSFVRFNLTARTGAAFAS